MLVGKNPHKWCVHTSPPPTPPHPTTTALHGPIFNHVTGKEQIGAHLKDNLFKLSMKKLSCTLKLQGEQAFSVGIIQL